MSWRDLWLFITYAPRDSAYARAVLGEEALWGLLEHLAATIADGINVGNWQRANTGRKAPTPRPKPIKRPGAKTEEKRFGRGAIPIRDFNSWWENG